MTEFQFAGFLPELVHGEIYNPAEGIPLLVHMPRNCRAQGFYQHPGRLLRRAQFPGGQRHKIIRLQVQGGNHGVLYRLDKLRNAAHNLALFIQPEPVGLPAGNNFHFRQGLVDKLPGLMEIGNHHGFHRIAFKGSETAGPQRVCHVLYPEVYA